MELYFQLVREELYMPFVLYAVIVISIVIGFARTRTHPALKLLPWYGIFYMVGDPGIELIAMIYADDHTAENMINNYENLFMGFEFIVYSLFFYPYLNKKEKKIYIALAVLFAIFFTVLTIRDNINGILTRPTTSTIYTVQGALLLILCIFYFINIFRNAPVSKLTNLPSFWIAWGLFSMQFVLLPISYFESYLMDHFGPYAGLLFALYNLFYLINFLTIIRAFLCHPKQTL